MESRALPTWRAPDPRWHVLLPICLVAVGYGSTVFDFFLSDDFSMLHNAATASGPGEAAKLGENWNRRFFRPLPLLSWWAQFPLCGLEPLGYRLVNLAVHATNACLVAWLTAVLGASRLAGAVAGAAFAVFPNHPEAVTWLSGRADLFCTLGVAACLLSWLRFASAGGRARHLVLAAISLVWAVLSKEPGFLVVAFLPLVGVVHVGRPGSRLVAAWVALVLLAALLWVVRWYEVGGMGGVISKGGRGADRALRPGPDREVRTPVARRRLHPRHGAPSTRRSRPPRG